MGKIYYVTDSEGHKHYGSKRVLQKKYGGGVTTSTPSYDIYDLGNVGKAYGTSPGEPGWNPQADVNKDGVIDSRDLNLVGKYYEGSGSSSSQTYYTVEHTAPTGETANVRMTPSVYEKYKEAREIEYEEAKASQRKSDRAYVEAERERGQARQEYEAAKELGRNPIVKASYVLSPGEWFGFGVLTEMAASGLTGQSWEKRREEMMTSYSYDLIKSDKTVLQAGTEGALFAGGKAGLMALSGGKGAAGKASGFTLKGIYAGSLGYQYGTTVKEFTSGGMLGRMRTGENIARSFVYTTPAIAYAGAKSFKTIRGEPKMLRGMAGKGRKTGTSQKTTTKMKPKSKESLASTSYRRFAEYKYREYLGKKTWKSRLGGRKKTFEEFSHKLEKDIKADKKTFREAFSFVKSDIELSTGTKIVMMPKPKPVSAGYSFRMTRTPVGFPVRITRSRRRPASIGASLTSSKTDLGQRELPKELIAVSPKVGSAELSAILSLQSQRQRSADKPAFLQPTGPASGRVIGRIVFPTVGIGAGGPPILPRLGDAFTDKGSRKLRRELSRSYRYTPSLAGIVGLAPPARSAPRTLTGLGIRPVLKKRRRKR